MNLLATFQQFEDTREIGESWSPTCTHVAIQQVKYLACEVFVQLVLFWFCAKWCTKDSCTVCRTLGHCVPKTQIPVSHPTEQNPQSIRNEGRWGLLSPGNYCHISCEHKPFDMAAQCFFIWSMLEEDNFLYLYIYNSNLHGICLFLPSPCLSRGLGHRRGYTPSACTKPSPQDLLQTLHQQPYTLRQAKHSLLLTHCRYKVWNTTGDIHEEQRARSPASRNTITKSKTWSSGPHFGSSTQLWHRRLWR